MYKKILLILAFLYSNLYAINDLKHEFYFSNNIVIEEIQNIKNSEVLEEKLIYNRNLNSSLLASFRLIDTGNGKISSTIQNRLHIGQTYLLTFEFEDGAIADFSLTPFKKDKMRLDDDNSFYISLTSFHSYKILNYDKILSTTDKTVFLKNKNKLSISFQ